jgi:hypothetical protein
LITTNKDDLVKVHEQEQRHCSLVPVVKGAGIAVNGRQSMVHFSRPLPSKPYYLAFSGFRKKAVVFQALAYTAWF